MSEEETLADRLARAITESGRSSTAIGAAVGFQPGYIHKLLGTTAGKRIDSPGPDKLRRLSYELRVDYEWLATGRGEMRGGRASGGAREEAFAFARKVMFVREAAIEAVLTKHGGDEEDAWWNADDWVLAISLEERRLQRSDIAHLAREKELLLKQLAETERRSGAPLRRLRPKKKKA